MILARTAALMIVACGHTFVAITPWASGQGASGQGASGQGASGQGVTGQGVTGQDPVGRPVERMDAAAAYLNPLYVNQWIGLSANRSISGKLVSFGDGGSVLPRSAVEVTLAQKGKAVSQAFTDTDGTFQFKNLAAGSYSFVAQSEYCFATFGIHVLPAGSGSPSSFEVCVAGVSSAAARELMRDNWVPADSDATEVFTKDPLAESRVISTSPKVSLQNGDLFGQVSRAGLPISKQDLTGNVAHVFKAGRSIAAAPIGRDGKFRIVNLAAGVYDLAVVGEDGNAIIGFEAIGPVPVALNQTAGTTRLISRQDASNSLNIELADPVVGEEPEEVPPPIVEDNGFSPGFGQPLLGGGFPGFGGGGGLGGRGLGGGGAGGGGGGLGGGGGIGGLLGIAGLAVGVAALSQDENFNPGLASLIVP